VSSHDNVANTGLQFPRLDPLRSAEMLMEELGNE
jgi:hypothetical protein